MEIETSRFGLLDIREDKIITLTRGLLGFPEERRYVLLPHRENSPFLWLQSVDRPELAFVVMNPAAFCTNYAFDLPDAVQKELQVETQEQINVLVIVTVPRDRPRDITANLLGPVVINVKERLACQMVLDPNMYPVRFPLTSKDEAKEQPGENSSLNEAAR